ncbi:GSCFA domain-containing protein, partial [Enterococcus faecium]|uniref:GSCFA domain-containing protein n=1 Tax=Enterococcus faecium TaxID=1352 RepID=UPI003AAE0A42
DDLRDYRFYAEDLVHPNYHATKYVWEKFVEACITEEAKEDIVFLQEIALAYKHNPFNPNTKQHIAFRKKYAQLAADFAKKHQSINLQEEIRYFETGERTSAPMLLKE